MALGFRHPVYGNSYNQDDQVLIASLMSGEVRVFRDPSWPSLVTQKMEVRALTSDQKDLFMNFVAAIAGTEIPMIDHEGQSWSGVFASDPEITCEGKNCLWKISFEFLGKKV
jgi:hypothetical protein